MDPFNKLPPELRLEILIATSSKRWILQLIRASPTMLRQYMPSKEYIERKLVDVDAEFDDDMLNDAIAIIQLPGQGDRHVSTRHHEKLWSEGWFASNWKKERTPINNKAILIQGEINQLYRRLVVLVEDYLTKATAACPAREYWCLPHRGGQLTFKDRAVCIRLDITQCNNAERHRLLKAFLKYEVVSKFCYSYGVKRWLGSHRRSRIDEVFTRGLREWEKEAIYCVEEYYQSLYKAVLIQCGNSQLPETPAARHISHMSHAPNAREWEDPEPIGHEYIGGDAFNPHPRLKTLNWYELCQWLACFGLDLATTVVEGATAGQHARAIVGAWLKDLAKRASHCGFFRTVDLGQTIFSLLNGYTITLEDGSYLDGPGLYKILYPRIEHMQDCSEQDKYLKLYRSRAWVFLDDARLFKSEGEGPHFPAEDVVFPYIRSNDIIGSRLDINLKRYSWEITGRTPPWWTPRKESRYLSQLLSLQEASTVRRA